MNDDRPDPDILLARVQAEEKQRAKGKLKIFLGYAAGVGKTYAMLEAARSRLAEGVDLVVALVETHGRADTEALLTGLEAIPRNQVKYRGVNLPEMDLDAVLARKPKLALVDELAHTNAAGSRHPKRWQDVEEVLNAGIDVYSTLNIQHLESFRDIVAQITGVVVRESLPDRVLDEAAEIEVVDLPPEELLQRLREGKVYIPEQAARAMDGFFESGNLIALREITLRRAANRVDEQMRQYLDTFSTPKLLPTSDRLLVLISGGPNSERLIRTARRLAEDLKTEWFALYVETSGNDRLTRQNREQIWRDLRLAESLGAKETLMVRADSLPDAVVDFARKKKITKIIIGRPIRPRLKEWWKGNLVDRILRRDKQIDLYVVSIPAGTGREKAERPAPSRSALRGYGGALLLVAAATAASAIASEFLSPTNMVMFYLLTVVLAALRLGFRSAILTAFLGVFAFDIFFVPPRFSIRVEDTEYLITFAGLFFVSAVVSTLVARARSQAEALRIREAQTATLYSLSKDLSAAVNLDDILGAVIRHASETVEAKVAVLLPEGEGLSVRGSTSGFSLGEKERSVALWAFRNRQVAGKGTDTLSSARLLYLPLLTGGNAVGVMGIQPGPAEESLAPPQRRLLEAYASQAALAVERANLARKAEEAQLLQASERLERSLLNSISHDLRTPLASIVGALSSLREEGYPLDAAARRELIDVASEEAGRMNRFVSNLLDMTRLEAGALKIRREPYDVQDLVGSALTPLEARLKRRKVNIDIPPNLPLIPMDLVLMAQVLINLLDNALRYSPPDSPLEVSVRAKGAFVEIEVADRGTGIPDSQLNRIFEKFFRLSPADGMGTGLGLSVCKGIVEAHQGRIRAENREGGGLRIILALPVSQREDAHA